MSLYRTSVNKPVTIALIFITVAILGVFSLTRLSTNLFPDMGENTILVVTSYSGASAADIETNVTKPLENALNSVSNLKHLSSTSKENISVISLEFEYGIGSLKDYCNEIPEGFKQINIPEHLWGKFYTKGKMPTTIQKLWDEVIDWVQNSKYEISLGYDFECYSEGDPNSDDFVSGIWVALKLKN